MRFLFPLLCLLLGCSARPDDAGEKPAVPSPVPATEPAAECPDFNSLNTKVRDGQIAKEEALQQLKNMVPEIKAYYLAHAGNPVAPASWIFPVQGGSAKNIGGSGGNGYQPGGYDYFKGNRHAGHPAHDIFIADKNQDALDDKTGRAVNVLSVSNGIVVAVETRWDSASDLRGGKYIWVYDPQQNSLFYYAHNREIFVAPCVIVKAGDTLATIGRTGMNAAKKRSPTHLHFMQLKLDDNGYPRPVNCFADLEKSVVR